MPFTATSTYDNEFRPKPRANRPAEPLTYTHRPAPSITVSAALLSLPQLTLMPGKTWGRRRPRDPSPALPGTHAAGDGLHLDMPCQSMATSVCGCTHG